MEYVFADNVFNNLVILTNNLSLTFVLANLILLNCLFFNNTNCKIKKTFSVLANLIYCTIAITLSANDSFAYLFLITETSAIVVILPIILSKNENIDKKKNLNTVFYFFTFFSVFTFNLFFLDKQTLMNYQVFQNFSKENNIISNDLYSFFLEIGLSYNIFIFFSSFFLITNMVIIYSVYSNKKIKFQNISHKFLSKKINSFYIDFCKKYKNNHKNMFFKFKK